MSYSYKVYLLFFILLSNLSCILFSHVKFNCNLHEFSRNYIYFSSIWRKICFNRKVFLSFFGCLIFYFLRFQLNLISVIFIFHSNVTSNFHGASYEQMFWCGEAVTTPLMSQCVWWDRSLSSGSWCRRMMQPVGRPLGRGRSPHTPPPPPWPAATRWVELNLSRLPCGHCFETLPRPAPLLWPVPYVEKR